MPGRSDCGTNAGRGAQIEYPTVVAHYRIDRGAVNLVVLPPAISRVQMATVGEPTRSLTNRPVIPLDGDESHRLREGRTEQGTREEYVLARTLRTDGVMRSGVVADSRLGRNAWSV